ncbi:MAG: redox-regulated ATPase YchF [Candidatus Bathyarchaeota archaeon]|nr:redox-regulated ATPase YchF [Candidatus Bathyarchaeum tardum]WGM89436.1 MAG: redox-regulated ATPase YchF [Candidatus Bathyarchaeum tardum]WNZ28287.1 MAG: redox-regulated ATPase YchF [Candidatus Bathyarchaeota archaeon]
MSVQSYSKKLGIVGKPNTGKSTFFSAATLIPVDIGNYPFTTIKPNRGIGYLRTPCVHPEFEIEDNPNNSLCLDGIRLVPIEMIDVAGIVPGAWEGRGLGNQFLDELRRADALLHVVDASGSTDCEGRICKKGEHDPLEDVKFLETEITMWMNQILKKDWAKIARTAGAGKEDLVSLLESRLTGLGIKRFHIVESLRKSDLRADKPVLWNNDDLIKFLDILRSSSKPTIIVANKIDCPHAEENVERLKQSGHKVVACCAEAELALRRAAENGLINYTPGDCKLTITKSDKLNQAQENALNKIQENILYKFGSTGVQEAINTAFIELLQMVAVYPVEDVEHLSDHKGRVLPDVYLVPFGTTARQLAYIIHTELGDSFIHAIDIRGKTRIGEDYVLKDRDVISIVSAKKRG